MITQSAETHFSAAHRGGDGQMHGHTWRVRATWPYRGQDIDEQRERLIVGVSQLDHSELPPDLTRAEQIAHWIGLRVDACRVDVWREAEGLGATWRA